MTHTQAEGRLCPGCQLIGEETWLAPDTFYCDQCNTVYCPYCGAEPLEACEHSLGATYTEADERLQLILTDLGPFPTIELEEDPEIAPAEWDQMAADAFGPLLPIFKAYGIDSGDAETDDGPSNFRAGVILEACLSHLQLPFHAIAFETSSGMGGSYGTHYMAKDGSAATGRVTELQGRLAACFETLNTLLDGRGEDITAEEGTEGYWGGIFSWETEADNSDGIVWVDGVGWVDEASADQYGGAAETIRYSLDLSLAEGGTWTAIPDSLGGSSMTDDLSQSGLDAAGVADWVESYCCPLPLLVEALHQEKDPALDELARGIETYLNEKRGIEKS